MVCGLMDSVLFPILIVPARLRFGYETKFLMDGGISIKFGKLSMTW